MKCLLKGEGGGDEGDYDIIIIYNFKIDIWIFVRTYRKAT